MIETLIALLGIATIVVLILLAPVLVSLKRDRIKQRSFPPIWQAIIEQTLPFYSHLSSDERRRLKGHIQVFLTEKQFIGCAGLQVTEEMKVMIAAIACLLLLNEQGQYFPKLRSILIYPTAYRVNTKTAFSELIVQERQETRLGESWSADQVVLAWNAVKRDVSDWSDGHNVVLHEFAHQLDQADGRAEGVPILPSQLDYDHWKQIMTQAYEQLCRDVGNGVKTVMDSYGTTNGAEFFAVATETFFEKPHALRIKHPDLYEQLRHYYQIDPMQWMKKQ